MNLSLASAVGLAGALLAFATTLPQAAKLMRLRSAAGVSVAALANSTVSGLAWTAFGVLEHDAWVALTAVSIETRFEALRMRKRASRSSGA